MLAGDTLPIDVYCHLPIMCEDRNLPYAYIPSKAVSVHPSMAECLKTDMGFFIQLTVGFSVCFQDLGSSAGSKRPTCVILIKPHEDYRDAYNECMAEVSSLPKPL